MAVEKAPQFPVARDHKPPGSTTYRVRDEDDWNSIARKFGIAVRGLLEFNFKTHDPAEINWYLRHNVGCRHRSADGQNYVFRGADPGIIHIPGNRRDSTADSSSAPENRTPMVDEADLIFRPAPSVTRPRRFVVVYVNGMNTDGLTHRQTAERIANEIGHNVVGVFNAKGMSERQAKGDMYMRALKAFERLGTDPSVGVVARTAGPLAPIAMLTEIAAKVAWVNESFLADLIQCAEDYTKVAMHPVDNLLLRLRRSQFQRHMKAKELLAGNESTLKLYELLYNWCENSQIIRLIAHSQGNLIVRNALTFVWWVRGRDLRNVTVYALASPASSWPDESGVRLKLWWVDKDLVPKLSTGRSMVAGAEKIHLSGMPGFGEQHDANTYFDHVSTTGQHFFGTLRADMGLTAP